MTTDVDRIVEAIHEGIAGLGAALRPPWPRTTEDGLRLVLPDGSVVAVCGLKPIDLVVTCPGGGANGTVVYDSLPMKPEIGTNGEYWWPKPDSGWHAGPLWVVSRIACDDPTAVITFRYRGKTAGVFTGRDLRYGRSVYPIVAVYEHLSWSFRSITPATVIVSGLLLCP